MTDRAVWLALTIEDAIEPELEICDSHHHLWHRGGSRYLTEEFLGDTSGHNVTKSVYVECQSMYRETGPHDLRPVGETEFIHGISAHSQSHTTWIAAGILGFADLSLGPAVLPVLEAHVAASGRFRGVRHASAWDEDDGVHNAHTNPSRHLLSEAPFREGFACLANLGLSFDAWVYFHQLPELTDLARAFPGTAIVLNHVGGPIGIGPYAGRREEVFEIWRRHMTELAACGNVNIKLGGLTMAMAGFGWHKRERPASSLELADAMSPYYKTCIELFGAGRCMFESNFPVDGRGNSYTILWNAFKRVSQDYSKSERAALLHNTAVNVYNLEN